MSRSEGNFNDLLIEGDQYGLGKEATDLLARSSVASGTTTVYFKNIKYHLMQQIWKYPVIVGAVAWMTDLDIIRALSRADVSIIVNKMDFLRPDSGDPYHLRDRYNLLKNRLDRYQYKDTIVDSLSVCSDPTLDPVRCVGEHTDTAHKRNMHHKFLVFCNLQNPKLELGKYLSGTIEPLAVWTGSFNFTKNADESFENALLIFDKEVAKAYYQEWGKMVALSESLDWKSNYIAPDYRVGT